MRIKIILSSTDDPNFQFAATYVVDETIAFDAGSIGFSSLDGQKKIRHLFISHTHLDHISSLPIFIDNVYAPGHECPRIYASQRVLDDLRDHFFNDRIWPNIFQSPGAEEPFAQFIPIQANQPIVLDKIRVTPVSLHHVVPCFGFLVQGPESAFALVSDTGPTDEIWNRARQVPELKTIFLEAAFPNSFAWLAEKAKHLTPELFRAEYHKLGRDIPIIAIHIKPSHYGVVVQELKQLGIPKLVIGEPDRVYEI
jgi:cAMP phosphodiesterase